MGEWQSIDTAPRDGTEILAWFALGYCDVVFYNPIAQLWTTGEDVVHPKKWMPLPEAPAA